MSVISLLHSIGIFEELSSEDLNVLADTLTIHRYAAGELIFRQGETGSTMYIVLTGQVSIYLQKGTGRRLLLQEVTHGEYFGELALFDDEPRSATARAKTDVELLELTKDALTNYVLQRPHVAILLLRTVAARLRATNLLLSQRAAKNVDEEIDKHLTWQDRLADKVAELNGSWAFIILLLTLTLGWMGLNSISLMRSPFDPYPFVFFNLLLAILVALQGPLIVMSQNRQSLKDRARAETDYHVNLKNEVNIELLLSHMNRLDQDLNQRLQALDAKLPGENGLTPRVIRDSSLDP